MRLRQQLLTRNYCYVCGGKIAPKGVMVHSTGANNPRVSRYVPGDQEIGRNTGGNHWNQTNAEWKAKYDTILNKCVHAFVGKFADGQVGTVQTLPWTMRGWHCAGTGNNTHIGFEICEDGLSDPAYFAAVYREAVELTAMLCKQYSLNPLADGVVICHQEGYRRGIASNHGDVLHWFPKMGKSMDDFRADVAKQMGVTAAPTAPVVQPPKEVKAKEAAKSKDSTLSGTYTITASAGLHIRTGAGTSKASLAVLPKGTQARCYGYYTAVSGVKWLYVQATHLEVTYTGFCSGQYLRKQ